MTLHPGFLDTREYGPTMQMVERMLNARDRKIAALEAEVAELKQQLALMVGRLVIEEGRDAATVRHT